MSVMKTYISLLTQNNKRNNNNKLMFFKTTYFNHLITVNKLAYILWLHHWMFILCIFLQTYFNSNTFAFFQNKITKCLMQKKLAKGEEKGCNKKIIHNLSQNNVLIILLYAYIDNWLLESRYCISIIHKWFANRCQSFYWCFRISQNRIEGLTWGRKQKYSLLSAQFLR